MSKFFPTKSKQFLAILLAIILVAGLIPISSPLRIVSAFASAFTVEIDNTIRGEIVATLTNEADSDDTLQVSVTDGKALFNDFYDSDKLYLLEIKGMIGYEDYSESGITGETVEVSYAVADFDELDTIQVSGQITDENGTSYTEGGEISYSGYDSGSVNLAVDGTFTATIYKSKEYTFTFSPTNIKYKSPVNLGTVNSNIDISDLNAQLEIKTFSIVASAGADGAVAEENSLSLDDVEYGSDRSIKATADENYRIAAFTVDGAEISEAVGKQEYIYPLNNITADVIIDVTFIRKTYEISFSVGENGTVNWDNVVSDEVGKVIVNEGDKPGFTVVADSHYHIQSLKVDDEEQIEVGDTTRTFFYYEFEEVTVEHNVSISFTIDLFDVNITSIGNGTIMVGETPAGTKQTVSYDEELSFVLTPDEGYDVEEILLDGSPIDNYSLMDSEEEIIYTYILSAITNTHSIQVTFSLIEEVDEEDLDGYKIDSVNLISDYPRTSSDGTRVYNFSNNGASITFSPKLPYTKIRINGKGGGKDLEEITSSELITKIQLYSKPGLKKTRWVEVDMEPIQIIIDKTAPEVVKITEMMEWTKEDATIEGEVDDEDTTAAPSSGLAKVVYSKTELNNEQALAETTNIANLDGKKYSFTISDEQDNETFYVYAIDNADNVSEAKTVNVKIDKTLPEITGFTFKELADDSQKINFLADATFYNKEIEVEVTAQDIGISSGLNIITLYSDGNLVEEKAVTGSSATFTLSLADFANNIISASVKDNAGNESDEKKPTDVFTNASSDVVSLNDEEPTVSITPTSEAIYTRDNEKWYNGNVGFTVDVGTESGGIYSVEIKVNGRSIETDMNKNAINTEFFKSETLNSKFDINTSQNAADGKNKIKVTVYNKYGNKATACEAVYIDTTNPKIADFSITKQNDDVLSKILNFLTFGNFYNKKVKITVIADDRYGATSGVSTITLYADGEPIAGSPKAVTALSDGTYKAEFVLPEKVLPQAKILDVDLSVVATDNVGNITGKNSANPKGVPVTPTNVNADLKSDKMMIETVNPVVDISYAEPVFTDSDKRKWYSGNVQFTVTATDVDSGIRSIQIKLNNEEILTDANGKAINAQFYKTEVNKKTFKVNTRQGVCADDGSYLIEVNIVDNAGNKYSASEKVYKDISKPSITSYHFIPADSDGISKTSEFIDYLEYGYYFKKEFTAVIKVSDPDPSSGLKRVKYRLVTYQDGKKTGTTTGTQNIVNDMAAITIPQGFKGQIYVEAFDNTGNKSSKKTSRAIVVDHTSPEISITNNDSTSNHDADGNKLYVSDMSFTVVVSDNGSGIREIGYSLSAEKEPFKRKNILLNNTGYSVGDILEDGWVVLEMDSNLVTKVTKTFLFNSDDNDIVLMFDATDRSGNKLENIQSEKVTIDKTSPIINVVFRSDESKNDYYYNSNRIADITVIDRNFDPDLIIATIENDFGQVPTVTFTEVSKTEHVAVIDFDEGDYTFDVTGTDLGNHVATVNYSGGNETLFYVDKTSPIVEDNFATFSMNETEDSFNTEKIVTIKVTEHNFAPELMNLTIKMKEAGQSHTGDGLVDVTAEFSVEQWESDGDIHTISFTLYRDAVYQIEMTPLDLGENSSEYRSTAVFEIDQTVPVVTAKNGSSVYDGDIEFVDVYTYARKDEPAPTIEFDDLNIDHINYALTVYTPDNTSPEALSAIKPVQVYLEEDTDKSGKIMGNIFTMPDLVKDGVYALELIAVDVAGNESLLNLNTYARMIEQDILAYILGSNLTEKTGVYSFQYENGDAISKRPDNFSDIKISVLSKKDTDIDIVLRDNNADEINTNAQATTDDSIYGVGIYNYTVGANFFKENFQDDIDVELHLTVKNNGDKIDLGKLHIDNIAPTCEIPDEFKSWCWYYGEDDRTITVSNISELIDENQCRVYDNGKEVGFEYSIADNNLEFTLEKGWHNVGIVLDDMAGNANNIAEKANIHIGFFWLRVIIVLSVTLIIGLTVTVIYNVRKKRKLEKD